MPRWLTLACFAAGCAGANRAPAPPDRPALPADVTPAQWNASLQSLRPGLADCKARHPSEPGRVEVQIDVARDGAPEKVLAFGGVAGPLRECVATLFRHGRYPPSSKGSYRYVYPINYR